MSVHTPHIGYRNGLDDRFDRHDVRVNFGKIAMPEGYSVWWLADYEMYYWHRDRDDHLDGPYCDRFHARRGAVHDSKQPQ